MSKTLILSLAAVASVVALSACTEQSTTARTLAPGKYESSTMTKDANGTVRKSDSLTEVQVDEYGNKKTVLKSKKTTDPKGLFNKQTSKSKTVIEDENY